MRFALLAGLAGASVVSGAGTTGLQSQTTCLASPVSLSPDGSHDISGAARGGVVWALVFEPPRLLNRSRAEFAYRKHVKIAWHVTGRGPLRIAGRGPGGAAATLTSGPDRHQSSTWQRPGREWGSVISFARPGCWRIEVRTDTTRGAIRLLLRRRSR